MNESTKSLIEKLEAEKSEMQWTDAAFNDGIDKAIAIVRQHTAAPDEETLIKLLTPIFDIVGGDLTVGGIKRNWAKRCIEELAPFLGKPEREISGEQVLANAILTKVAVFLVGDMDAGGTIAQIEELAKRSSGQSNRIEGGK